MERKDSTTEPYENGNFSCCGLELNCLFDLIAHVEEVHINKTSSEIIHDQREVDTVDLWERSSPTMLSQDVSARRDIAKRRIAPRTDTIKYMGMFDSESTTPDLSEWPEDQLTRDFRISEHSAEGFNETYQGQEDAEEIKIFECPVRGCSKICKDQMGLKDHIMVSLLWN